MEIFNESKLLMRVSHVELQPYRQIVTPRLCILGQIRLPASFTGLVANSHLTFSLTFLSLTSAHSPLLSHVPSSIVLSLSSSCFEEVDHWSPWKQLLIGHRWSTLWPGSKQIKKKKKREREREIAADPE